MKITILLSALYKYYYYYYYYYYFFGQCHSLNPDPQTEISAWYMPLASQNPYPIIILSILRTLQKPSYPLFDKYNFRDHNICSPFFLCIYLYKVNFSTANLLLNSYSKMCDTIIMFNLIIPNLDVKMRPRPAANPHQQEKKTRKYYIYVMFQFAGNSGWLYTGYCQKQLKTLFSCLLLMHL